MVDENKLDETLFDLFGKKLMLARQELAVPRGTEASLRLTLDALDNLYALMSHKVMGEDTH